ncbi:hypothetical protein ARMSODRAFT_727559 [Armillaria solidipes]|uniref:Uncharacterized protein n=1 Tax=Armillaria solidipes TaxID=1076256 RepID=A0A2H3B779_9AGAR|nr:hypothetical protein ARMSODRAFT_727559 [Armillaria solidipes]
MKMCMLSNLCCLACCPSPTSRPDLRRSHPCAKIRHLIKPPCVPSLILAQVQTPGAKIF